MYTRLKETSSCTELIKSTQRSKIEVRNVKNQFFDHLEMSRSHQISIELYSKYNDEKRFYVALWQRNIDSKS